MTSKITRPLLLAVAVTVPLGGALLAYTFLTPPGAQIVSQKSVEQGATPEPALVDPTMEMAPPAPAPSHPPMFMTRSAGVVARERGVLVQPVQRGDRFAEFKANGIKMVAEEPVSTFSVDVDTASYAYLRRSIEMGTVPPADAIRVEELINYFDYDYGTPEPDGAPFASTISVSPSPWKAGNKLVHIGIKGKAVEIGEVAPANLVFLIDTSGSMDAPDKLPLLKRAFTLLVDEMRPQDTISIVTYAGSAGVALEPTKASEKAKILAALEDLRPSGSTAGAEGIEAAYRLAEQGFLKDGTNRVLLATDGDFNVGLSDADGLESFIEKKRKSGVFLSVLGFGTGNLNDQTMQALAQAGNGNAAYIDSYSEARKVLVEELGGTLHTIAKDVKVQVEFNPVTVSEYRLVGYETRLLDREDFNNDAVDAGDIGAGHSVTAIYEITPTGAQGSVDPLRYAQGKPAAAPDQAGEYGFLKLRYKAPDGDTSKLIETPIAISGELASLDAASADTRFAVAVASFGQKLRGSAYLTGMDWKAIRDLAHGARGDDPTGRRAEFLRLVDTASGLPS